MSDATLTYMLKSAGRLPVLPHEKQLILAKQVQRWLHWTDGTCPDDIRKRGVRAKQKMMETNFRLVVNNAKRYRHFHNGNQSKLLDLIQEGCLGLARAIDKFDPLKGYQFSTYATWWIRQAISRYIQKHGDTIRIPCSIHTNISILAKAISRYEAQHGSRPSVSQLSEITEIPIPTIERTIVVGSVKTLSLDFIVHNDEHNGSTLGDLLHDPDALTPEKALEDSVTQDLANKILDSLPQNERDLLVGLHFNNLTYTEFGNTVGLSRTRIGQIRQRIIAKIREQFPDLVAASTTPSLLRSKPFPPAGKEQRNKTQPLVAA